MSFGTSKNTLQRKNCGIKRDETWKYMEKISKGARMVVTRMGLWQTLRVLPFIGSSEQFFAFCLSNNISREQHFIFLFS